MCAHSCTCTHALPPGGRCSRAPAGVPTVLVCWGPMAFAVNGQLTRARGRVWRMRCPGHDTRVLLLGQDRAPGRAQQLSGSPECLRPGTHWHLAPVLTTAPSPEKRVFGSERLLLALGTQARRRPEPSTSGEGGGVPSPGLLLPPSPHLDATPVRAAGKGGRQVGRLGAPAAVQRPLLWVSGVRVEDQPGGPCPVKPFINKQ